MLHFSAHHCKFINNIALIHRSVCTKILIITKIIAAGTATKTTTTSATVNERMKKSTNQWNIATYSELGSMRSTRSYTNIGKYLL